MPNFIHAKQLLIELVETEYEIHDHANNSSPLAAVAFNESEKFENHYLLETYLDLFLYKKVNKYLGLTFDEFIDRPRYEIDKMITAIDGIMSKEASTGEGVLNDITNANKAANK